MTSVSIGARKDLTDRQWRILEPLLPRGKRPGRPPKWTQVEPPGPEPADHALGRSRGGWTTKVHLACELGRKPLSLVLTAGQRGDSPQFAPVLHRIRVSRCGPGRPRTRPYRVLADKAYSAKANREHLRRRKIPATITVKVE